MQTCLMLCIYAAPRKWRVISVSITRCCSSISHNKIVFSLTNILDMTSSPLGEWVKVDIDMQEQKLALISVHVLGDMALNFFLYLYFD